MARSRGRNVVRTDKVRFIGNFQRLNAKAQLATEQEDITMSKPSSRINCYRSRHGKPKIATTEPNDTTKETVSFKTKLRSTREQDAVKKRMSNAFVYQNENDVKNDAVQCIFGTPEKGNTQHA